MRHGCIFLKNAPIFANHQQARGPDSFRLQFSSSLDSEASHFFFEIVHCLLTILCFNLLINYVKLAKGYTLVRLGRFKFPTTHMLLAPESRMFDGGRYD